MNKSLLFQTLKIEVDLQLKLAVEAGYLGYKAGRMDQKYYAIPSSPFDQISTGI